MLEYPIVKSYLADQRHSLLFATLSGAHLYGFESPDSDFDVRGAHVTPTRDLLRLDPPSETIEVMDNDAAVEIDLVTHDVAKYFKLLLGRNGYVLEQIYSPLVACSTPEFEELRSIARGAITRHHRHHYRGFAENQWELVIKNAKPTFKGLLYTYRVLLAGTHLMQTGEVEANLARLNESFRLPYIDDLIARKRRGAEKQALPTGELGFHEREFVRLREGLEAASAASNLPEAPSCRAALEDLLLRVRAKYGGPVAP
jgi:uncharacterized protein